MEEVVAGVERRQFELLRDLRRGAVAADGIGPRIESIRSDTLAAARGFLDPAQSDLFADRAERYFDALAQRAARGEPGPTAPKSPAPDDAGSTATGTGD
jgi:hypothetical protein